MNSNDFIQAVSLLTDKNGVHLLPYIEDMRLREHAVLIVNLAGDDGFAQINAYVSEHYTDTAAAGIAALAGAGGCREIVIYSGETEADKLYGMVRAVTGAEVSMISGPASPVLRDETALFSVMDTGLIRVNRAEHDYNRNCINGGNIKSDAARNCVNGGSDNSYISYGYHGCPTLVIDGETAYQAGRLSLAPDAELTKLISITSGGADGGTVIMEAAIGSPMSALLNEHDTGRPILIGGICGSVLSGDMLEGLKVRFSYEHDSIRVFSPTDCVINELAGLYSGIREISCAKCVMCRDGSWQLSAVLSDITKGRSNRDDIALIEDICPIIHAGALCAFGKNMVDPIMSAVEVYRGEFEKHVIGRRCDKGKCSGLVKYVIDPSLCTGCGDCTDECPEEAIDGQGGFIHVIDDKLCEKCGKCVDVCPERAIKVDTGEIRALKKPVRVGRFS